MDFRKIRLKLLICERN